MPEHYCKIADAKTVFSPFVPLSFHLEGAHFYAANKYLTLIPKSFSRFRSMAM
jgi:predicted NAD-dependent protein-ADP-ribosyltransferase YbiA (DUF1768 family)